MANDTHRKYEFRCPVHGFIPVNDWEREIINQPAFQRLRRIRQLAWTDYVYPGAMHTRFEHSLGVMHVATQLFDAIVGRSGDLLRSFYSMNDDDINCDRQIVRLTALLHDTGHSPFSHAGEDLFPLEVLSDLSIAFGRNIVKEETYHYSGGYGYRITPSDNAKTVSIDLDSSYADIVDRAINEFGTRTAAELELRSTIMYVDRDFHQSKKLVQESDIAAQVRDIKPHFTEARILEAINDMKSKNQHRSLGSTVADVSDL